MTTLFVDIETFSSVDLKKASAYRYAESEDFQILMAAWAIDDGPIRISIGEDEIRQDLTEILLDPTVELVAHNAPFERICFSRLLLDGKYLPPENWTDTAAMAAVAGLPRSLEKAARALGQSAKDGAGTRLINLFAKPNRKGERNDAESHPSQWLEFVEYCVQDVVVLRDLFRVLPRLSETETQILLTDQRINDRGVLVDLELAVAAEAAAEANKLRHRGEVIELTGVENPGSVQQMLAWFESTGLPLPNMRAETVSAALEGEHGELSPTQRSVLELRQHLALTTSKKYGAALRSANADGRLRGTFRYYGAHTGRWSGQGIQLHNLSRAQVENTEAEILDLKLGFGADDATLRALVRPMLLGPFTIVDFSAIEARVLAWLAGERWALEAFRAGRDIYEETAKRMSTDGTQLTRQQGKVATLALGFAGGVNSLRVMGGEGTDEELMGHRDAWRRANQEIVRFWNGLDAGSRFPPQRIGKHVTMRKVGRNLRIELPSDRLLHYRNLRWVEIGEDDNWHPSHPSNKWARMVFTDPRYGPTTSYGGRLAENITQAVARDVQAEAMVHLDAAGYRVVAHVHDEVLVEGTDVPGVTEVMTQVPDWAPGLPIDADGEVALRYKKG